MASARALVKFAVERLLGSRSLGLLRPRGGLGCLVLAYHNIVPGPGGQDGDRSLHLSFERFREHLDLLQRRVSIVSLDQVLGGAAAGSVAITFDDAYESALSVGIPELARRDLPATVFVAPGLLGDVPWWDAVASSPEGLDETDRDYCLTTLRGSATAIFDWASSRSRLGASGNCRISNEDLIRQLKSFPRITVGAHSWTHPNLGRMEDSELERELIEPLRWLKDAFPVQGRPWLAYPYGLFTDELTSQAGKAGYEATFAIRGGWSGRAVSPNVPFPRLNVPAGLSAPGLAARLNGFLD